jgi:hypothetical protein
MIDSARNSIVAALAIVISSATSFADEPKKEAPNVDSAQFEKLMADFAKLAPQHELFKPVVGHWKTETKSYWENPGGEPQVTNGTAWFKLMMGGRFVMQYFQSEMKGQKFEGMGIKGYDKVKKKYVGVWVDSMNTSMMPFEGDLDEKTGVMTEWGEAQSPIGPMKMKMVTKAIDVDNFTFTMYMAVPGSRQMMKGMVITYTRDKEGKSKKKPAKKGSGEK